MARHRKEAKVYFAADGEEGYYIGNIMVTSKK